MGLLGSGDGSIKSESGPLRPDMYSLNHEICRFGCAMGALELGAGPPGPGTGSLRPGMGTLRLTMASRPRLNPQACDEPSKA